MTGELVPGSWTCSPVCSRETSMIHDQILNNNVRYLYYYISCRRVPGGSVVYSWPFVLLPRFQLDIISEEANASRLSHPQQTWGGLLVAWISTCRTYMSAVWGELRTNIEMRLSCRVPEGKDWCRRSDAKAGAQTGDCRGAENDSFWRVHQHCVQSFLCTDDTLNIDLVSVVCVESATLSL